MPGSAWPKHHLPGLETGNPSSRCQQGHALSETPQAAFSHLFPAPGGWLASSGGPRLVEEISSPPCSCALCFPSSLARVYEFFSAIRNLLYNLQSLSPLSLCWHPTGFHLQTQLEHSSKVTLKLAKVRLFLTPLWVFHQNSL